MRDDRSSGGGSTTRRSCVERALSGLIALLLLSPATIGAQEAQESPPSSPSIGEKIPAFDADGVDGVHRHIDFPKGSTTILLFFLSGCPVCHRMIPEWNSLYERKDKSLQVVGVLMDREPPGFFLVTNISFPVVRAPSNEFLRQLKVNRAPLTLRVGPGGVINDLGLGQQDLIRLGELFRP